MSAADNVGIREVRLTKDGTLVCAVSAAPYQCSVKLNRNRRASTLEATATDTSGNTARSSIQVSTQ
jgi:hypothetical protein